jgi:predicted peroxiredoxin
LATILYTSTYGSDDPTRASIPFVSAVLGALEAGHQPQIALLGEATYLMKDCIAEQIDGVGWPPLKELLAKAIDHGVPIYV